MKYLHTQGWKLLNSGHYTTEKGDKVTNSRFKRKGDIKLGDRNIIQPTLITEVRKQLQQTDLGIPEEKGIQNAMNANLRPPFPKL